MNFTKYTSIENAYKTKYLNKIQMFYPKEKFIVQEKVHGANFSFWLDEGGNIKCAKRTGFIDPEDKFFEYERMLKNMEGNVYYLLNHLSIQHNTQNIVLYGEICGGEYPHDDVARIEGFKSVQKGIWYHPDIQFIAFDIKVDDEFIGINAFERVCSNSGVLYTPRLFEGTLEECLKFENSFNTRVPTELFGLPEIKENTCEGTVIKPIRTCRLPNGERVVIKNKNDKFMEKTRGKTKKVSGPTKIPEHLVKFYEEIGNYVTENRLKNVISKEGVPEDEKTAFGQLLKPFNLDIIEDFIKDNDDFQELEKADRKLVTRYANGQAANLIRKNFMNILDGEF